MTVTSQHKISSHEERSLRKWGYYALLGISTLTPWNAFISATEYYEVRFKNSYWEKSFESVFAFSYNLVVLFTSLFLLFDGGSSKNEKLVFVGFVPLIAVFLIYSFIALIQALSADVFMFFALICIIVSGCSSSILGTGLSRKAAVSGDFALSALFTGQGISGLLIGLITLFNSYTENESSAKAGDRIPFGSFIQFFTVFLQLSAIFFIYLKTESIKIKTDTSKEPLLENEVDNLSIYNDLSMKTVPVLKKIWKILLSIIFCFVVTLSLYPTVPAKVQSSNTDSLTTHQFVGWLFLIFNASDFCGRFLTTKFFFKNQISVFLVSLFRFLLVYPSLNLNFHNLGQSETLLQTNFAALFVLSLLGVSNGFLCSNAIILGPRDLESEKSKNLAATACMLSLSVGLTLGSCFSFLISAIIM